MNAIQKLIVTGACASAVALAVGASAAPSGHRAGQDTLAGGHSHHGVIHHARWGKGGHGGFGRFCGKRREARTERMIAFVEGLMTFTPAQEAAWNDLTKSVRDGNKSMDETCESLKQDADAPKSATERFARMETMLAAGLKFVQSVRPKFDKFYATLSDKQKRAFDSLANRRRGR